MPNASNLFKYVTLEFYDGSSINLDINNQSIFTPLHMGHENGGIPLMATCYNINFPQLTGLNDVILLTPYNGYLYFHKKGDFITNASRRKLFLKNGTAIYANLLHEVFEVLNFNNEECKNYDSRFVFH